MDHCIIGRQGLCPQQQAFGAALLAMMRIDGCPVGQGADRDPPHLLVIAVLELHVARGSLFP
jgi:hypothetical protein